MEKIIKIIILNTLLILMAVIIGGCVKTGSGTGTGSGLITIKVQYKLGDVPSPNWDGVQVVLSGPVIVNLTTQADGKIQTSLAQGNYTVEASTSNYDVVTNNVVGSVEGQVYDLGVQVLQSTTPPPPAY